MKRRSFVAKLSVFALFLSVVVSGPVSAATQYTEFGRDWTQVSSDYAGLLATSDSGAIVYNLSSPYLYRSSNYGETWANVTNQLDVSDYASRDMAVSGDGSLIVITEFSGFIWISRNSGASWSKKVDPLGNGGNFYSGSPLGSNSWSSVLVSQTGQRIVITVGDSVFKSSDYGNTFSQTRVAVAFIGSNSSMSDDGRVILVGEESGDSYVSRNYGASFLLMQNFNPSWFAFAVSGDGNYLLAVDIDGSGIWVSSDEAESWSQPTFNSGDDQNIQGVAISTDGSRIIVIGLGRPPLTSDDFGATFTERNSFDAAFDFWASVTMSSDGSVIYLGGDTGVYKSVQTALPASYNDYGTVTLLLAECMSDTSTATSVRAASVVLVSDTASAAAQGDGSTYKYYSETDTALWGADYTYGSTQNKTTCGYRDLNGTVTLSRGRFIASSNPGILSETNTNTSDFLQYIGNTETASAYAGIACGNMGVPHAASVTTSCTTAIQAGYSLLTYTTPVQVRTSNVKTGVLGQPSGKIYTFVKVLKSVIASAPVGTSWVATETFTVTTS